MFTGRKNTGNTIFLKITSTGNVISHTAMTSNNSFSTKSISESAVYLSFNILNEL